VRRDAIDPEADLIRADDVRLSVGVASGLSPWTDPEGPAVGQAALDGPLNMTVRHESHLPQGAFLEGLPLVVGITRPDRLSRWRAAAWLRKSTKPAIFSFGRSWRERRLFSRSGGSIPSTRAERQASQNSCWLGREPDWASSTTRG
jgi:hypothetical protein